jgi:hypothetical protein
MEDLKKIEVTGFQNTDPDPATSQIIAESWTFLLKYFELHWKNNFEVHCHTEFLHFWRHFLVFGDISWGLAKFRYFRQFFVIFLKIWNMFCEFVIVCKIPSILWQISRNTGVYILENTPPPGGGEKISADVIWGKKYEKAKRKRGKM